LNRASKHGHLDVIAFLLAFGAQVDETSQEAATPLFMAAQEGHAGAVNLLLQHGANMNKAITLYP
jgi:ankyrin repeat protein